MKGSVRKRGENWSYYFTIGKVDGKYKKKEKGGFATKKEAEAALREALREFEINGLVENHTNYTIEEYVKYWFDNVAINYLKYETLHGYSNIAHKHIYPEIGHIPLRNATPALLQNFFSGKLKTYSADSIVSGIRNILSNSFKLAVKQNLLPRNPLSQIELKSSKTKEKKIRTVTKEDLEHFIKETKETRYYIAFIIAIQTGARRGEILGLTWEDIDFENNTLTINKILQYQQDKGLILSSTKTSSSVRTVLMTQTLVNELKRHKQAQDERKEYYGDLYFKEHAFVCCNDDGSPINPICLTQFTNKLSKKNGYPFRFHDLRHTHATLLLEADVNIKVVQQRLGHENIKTTLNVYSHITNKLEEDAIHKFDDYFNK
ncbi:tyrosine-type recombinase/integrase [Turicibacter sanguinis]|uniref:tyrosine-type recombinase/integrase n=1 Tax=Turicibacter sanguinis TaxID=154288 RepID=UPI00189D2E74|nr:site-specific integrase [Turicibacter sanguinis]